MSHNYNVAPFLTIGTEMIVHNKPKRRGDFRGIEAKDKYLAQIFSITDHG